MQFIENFQGVDCETLGQAFNFRGAAGVMDQVFERAAKAGESVGTYVINTRFIAVECDHIGIHQVVGVYELKSAIAGADDPDGSAFLNPFK